MKTEKVVGLDLGNGFMKIVADDIEVVEPSVYALKPVVSFQQGTDFSVTVDGQSFYLGNNALDSNLRVTSVVGNVDALTRYTSKEYKNLLFGFLAQVFGEDVTIEKLVLGLPNSHFAQCEGGLVENFSNKKEKVIVGEKTCTIRLEEVIVLPQPLGTYFYSDVQQKDIIVIDLGNGTNDYTEINKLGNIINMFSSEDALRKYHLEVLNYVRKLYPTHQLSLIDVPKLEENGIKLTTGEHVVIVDAFVEALREKYAGYILQPVIEQYDYLSRFDKIIITGGGAEVFKESVKTLKKELPNIAIVDNAQLANAMGFYKHGMEK